MQEELRGSTTSIASKMTNSTRPEPSFIFEGNRYSVGSMPDDLKELISGMRVADRQLRMHQDAIKVLAIGRKTIAMQVKEKIKAVTPQLQQ